jgi:ribonuclease VapC
VEIVADTSALLAVLLGEPERGAFHEALLDHRVVMSVVSITETMLVLRGRRGPAAIERVDRAIARYEIIPEAVGPDDLALLRQAMLDFGKGRRRPPAVLNFGDLFAYALARRLGLPLLYKGEDFARTDVVAALP